MADDKEKDAGRHGSTSNEDARAKTTLDEQTLPAQDRGKDVWLFLAGATVLQIVAWGDYECRLALTTSVTDF